MFKKNIQKHVVEIDTWGKFHQHFMCIFCQNPFAFYLFIANFFATQIIGGAKELVVLL